MPQSVRSILGKSRVTKARGSPSSSPRKKPISKTAAGDKDIDNVMFPDKFPDLGSLSVLTEREELVLRDVVQAMRYIRTHMFTPVPDTGFTSTRTAELLNYRARLAPVVTTGHVNAVLSDAPSRVERETGELIRRGILRKVRIERRAEALIEVDDLERMLEGSRQVSTATRNAYVQYIRQNPTAQSVAQDGQELTHARLDELVRAGFVTNASSAAPGNNTLHVRPEDRTTLMSIQHVSQFASGTISAVGGQNAIHLAGGGGGWGGKKRRQDGSGDFRIAVPGHGQYLKLADGVVDWIRDALSKTKWGEGPETWLRERFEGNGLYGTRWKEFWGLEWEWALGLAVGLGVVEVFNTGSVGRGVRALGP